VRGPTLFTMAACAQLTLCLGVVITISALHYWWGWALIAVAGTFTGFFIWHLLLSRSTVEPHHSGGGADEVHATDPRQPPAQGRSD
jgi:hypothetical protein